MKRKIYAVVLMLVVTFGLVITPAKSFAYRYDTSETHYMTVENGPCTSVTTVTYHWEVDPWNNVTLVGTTTTHSYISCY